MVSSTKRCDWKKIRDCVFGHSVSINEEELKFEDGI